MIYLKLKERIIESWERIKFLFAKFIGKAPNCSIDIKCKKLILGKNDGAWCFNPDDLHPESIIYSVGVGKDISFDLDLINKFNLKVHAFDPTPISKSWIEKQDLPDKFHFHPLGLADYDGQAEFYLPSNHNVSYILVNSADAETINCPVKTIDTIMSDLRHNQIDLLKLDVEGAEYLILKDIVQKKVKIKQIIVEFHHRMDEINGLKNTNEAIMNLKKVGYKLFHISPRGLEFSFILPN